MIDHDNLEEFRDAQIYDLQDEGYEDDYALTAQWTRTLGYFNQLADLVEDFSTERATWRGTEQVFPASEGAAVD